MNNLTKDIVAQTLQEILEDSPHFLCFTDHRRLTILSWPSKKVPNAQIVKIGDKRFIGFIRKDRNGASYWKYQPLTENTNTQTSPETNSTPDNPPNQSDPTAETNHEPIDHQSS